MQNTMVETDLSMGTFTHYFEAKRLGSLYFPNGHCTTPNRYLSFRKFFVDLNDLYKLVSGWKVNHTEVPLNDIVAVIAFGSAVRYPGTETIFKTRKKYLLFGENRIIMEEVPIFPRDVDFLVITEHNLVNEKILEPLTTHDQYGGVYIKQGGIHVSNRGVEQLLNAVRLRAIAGVNTLNDRIRLNNDTVSISALREGVPIFFDERFEEVVSQANIERTTPRKILWDENNAGFLIGRIE